MPVKAIPKLSIARNGIGAFVKPCHKVTVNFCNWGGSSQGVRDLLSHPSKPFHKLASQNNDVVFEVLKRNGHPSLTFHYNTGVQSDVDVRNLGPKEVKQKLQEYIQRSGNELFKFNHKVKSDNGSVRGVWSPFHVDKAHRHRI